MQSAARQPDRPRAYCTPCVSTLQGKERHPAFVVARSSLLTVLVVNAQVLAAAMPAALQQVRKADTDCAVRFMGLVERSSVSSLHPGVALRHPTADLLTWMQASAQPQGRPSGAKAGNSSGGSDLPEAAAALQQQDIVSVDALYQLIGQPRQQPVRLKPGQADQVRQLYSRQLQEAAAAEAATVGAWQQLPHQRISSATGTQGRPVTAARSRPAAASPQAPAVQGVLYEVRLGDELACAGTTAAGASRVRAEGTAECRRQEAGAVDVQTGAKQGADSQGDGMSAQQEERQQEKSNRSPLMHHAAIMQFAALRAAAVGQPQLTAGSL